MTSRRSNLEHLLTGYLYVELIGPNTDQVIRTLVRKNVPLYQVRVQGAYATCGFALRDFPVVYQVCHSNRIKIRFVRREGLPFLVHQARRRKTLMLGFAIFVGLLFVFQSVIWRVEVSGVQPTDTGPILQAAHAAGVYPGAALAKARDVNRLQFEIQKQTPSLMWVGVTVQGTIVRIQALEKVPGVAMKSNQPRNIVSSRPAVIRKVFASRGNVQVKPGQAVVAGQVLVSGALGGGATEVPASGVVLAEVWYRSEVTVPLKVSRQALSGSHIQFDRIELGPLAVRVWGWRDANYSSVYDQESDTRWKIGNWNVPVVLQHITRYEASVQAIQQSKRQALATALQMAVQDVQTKPGRERVLLGQTVLHSEVTHGKLYAIVLTRTEEDIGTPAPIPKTVPDNQKSSN